jgi:hypothetical protein
MYTYKCYFHPKDDSATSCKGCKLPLCAPCQGVEGVCRECLEKRRAVNQLRQLRTVAASKTHAASTTGRLRLAIQQAGPDSARRGPQPLPGMPTMASMHTRPLDPGMAAGLSRKLPPEPPVQPRRYNPEAVAYKPVMSRAAETRHQPVKRAPVKAAAKAASPTAATWTMPFVVGLAAGMVLVLLLLLGQSLMKSPGKLKARPAHAQGFTQQELATAEALLGADAAPLVTLEGGRREDATPQVGWTGK